LGRYDDALQSYQQASALKPDFANVQWNEGFCRLLLGDFAKGWEKYESRWQIEDICKPRDFSQPRWSGDTDVQDKTILLYAEQGLGDTLQFCRYVELLADLGAKVFLEVPASLKTLLTSLRGVSGFISRGDDLTGIDYHCPLLSLPLACQTRLETIPANIPYLFSQPDKVQRWHDRLGQKTQPRVGVVWSGNSAHKNDRNRSLPLPELLTLRTADWQLISLQKELRGSDAALLAEQPVLQHYGEQLRDFSDTAALIELMDVVISVDTSVAHLAAAMGKPTWILLPYAPDWRWLLEREDSPWYPTVRLFRQTRHGDWHSVLERVTDELNKALW
jgi:hypothetical protein